MSGSPTPIKRSLYQGRNLRERFRLRTLLLGGLAILLAYVLLAGDSGLLRVFFLVRELRQERAEVKELKAQRDALLLEKATIENDLEYLERVAREEYNMAAPGEIVYRFDEDSLKTAREEAFRNKTAPRRPSPRDGEKSEPKTR